MDNNRISISDAIKMVGISRSHFYNKYINKGVISVSNENDKKYIELSELIRVFGNVQNINKSNITTDNQNTAEKDNVIQLLEQQLREAKEREEWLKSQIDELRQQQNLLLEDKNLKKRKKFLGIF